MASLIPKRVSPSITHAAFTSLVIQAMRAMLNLSENRHHRLAKGRGFSVESRPVLSTAKPPTVFVPSSRPNNPLVAPLCPCPFANPECCLSGIRRLIGVR